LKKSHILLTAWSTVVIATGIILYLVFIGLVPVALRDLLYVIVGTAIVELSVIELSRRLSEPTILIEPIQRKEKIGFSVRVKDKNISKATVLCDELPVKWQEPDGNLVDAKELLVGANPSFFFPFWIEIDKYPAVANDKQYIYLRVFQKSVYPDTYGYAVFEGPYTIPRGSFEHMEGRTPTWQQFQTNIRIFGQGIEEEVDRFLNINFSIFFWRRADSDNLEDLFIRFGLRASKVRFFREKRRRFIPTNTAFVPKTDEAKTDTDTLK
jgi:hypothetical protein